MPKEAFDCFLEETTGALLNSPSVMADDAETLCVYCDSKYTQSDYALHRVSNNHVKKVRGKMLQHGFTSACLVCSCALKDLKQVELHVQKKAHTDRVKSFLVDSYLSKDKCTCGSCGITFFSEVALEAHCLSWPSHNFTGCPKLDELSIVLGGSCLKQFSTSCNGLCRICDATFPSIEDSINHMFTASHISRLRSSSCMVCKKKFNHASDRELHINGLKHHTALGKCEDLLLKEGQAHARHTKGGYPCMFCMIWCDSWFCLESHLLDKHHANASDQSKARSPISAKIVFAAVSEGIGQSESCNHLTMNTWRQWRSDASKECVWCHRCGISLSSIDEIDKHLNTHRGDRCLTTSRSHLYKLSDSAPVSEIFSCSVCAVSFRNALMLIVHEASFEHHSRLTICCLTHDVQCCSNCGLVVNNEGGGNGALGGSFPPAKRAEVTSKSPGLCEQQSPLYVQAKKTSSVRPLDTIMPARSSAEGTHQTSTVADKAFMEANGFLVPDKRGDNLLKGRMALGPKEVPFSGSGKTPRDGEGVDKVSIENGFIMNERLCTKYTHHDDHVRSQLGSAHALNPETGHTSTSFAASRNGIVARTSSTNTHENDEDHLPSEVSVPRVAVNSPLLPNGHLHHTCSSLDNCIERQNSLLLAGQVCDGNGRELTKKASFADTRVPIVVAATFAPLGTLQESLQSITAVLTESLSSALPAFYMQQSSPGFKRKSQAGVEEETCCQQDAKRMCPERILEAALRQGLRYVGLNAIVPNDAGFQCQGFTDEESVRIRRGDGGDVEVPQAVVAVAASVISNGKTVVEEKPRHLECSQVQPLFCAGAQNAFTSMPVSLANGAIRSMKNEIFLPAKKLTAALRVVKSGISKESKSIDDDDDADDDYFSFLDPTKGHSKWWSSSDSDDSDSVLK